MKIWVCYEGYDEDGFATILGVFDSEEKARDFCTHVSGAVTEEFEVNKEPVKPPVPPPPVPPQLRTWVEERQKILNRLLIEEPDSYMQTRETFQREFAKLCADLENNP